MLVSLRTVPLLFGVTLGLGCSTNDAEKAAQPQTTGPTEVGSASPDAAAPPPPKARPSSELPTPVSLSGEHRPGTLALVAPGRPRLYARALRVWIYERPSRSSRRLGYLRAGASSPTSAEPVSRSGCKAGWYPIEPRGFVCLGRRATLDANDPIVAATLEHPPDFSRKLPYIYGTVRRPGPVYARLPRREELLSAEPDIEERMRTWLTADGEIGAGYAQQVWLGRPGEVPDPARAWRERTTAGLPEFLRDHASVPNIYRKARSPDALVIEQMQPRVGHGFLRTFLHDGRRYGLSTDLRLLPTDRLRPIQGSDFHGVEIGKDIDFPFAFVRSPGAHYWIHQSSTGKLIDAGTAPYRATVKLTGKQRFFKDRLHYETEDGKWLSDLDASRLDPAKRMPGWGKAGEKWIDINLTKQTLMLYEGERPVYATLISSGEAGLSDPEHTTATKRGIFRIHTKHVTATMSSDEAGEEFELRDVPYVQYFDKEGYALHGAYWHDRFGIPKSHGCINLSPEDARRVFFWTEPQLPTGWHGVLLPLKGTVMFVHP